MTARPLDWLDLTGAGFALLGLVQRRRAAFFRRLRLCIAKQKSRASPSSAALRPQAVRARSSPLHRSPSRPRRSRPEIERNFDMATIGTFTQAANGSFTGTIKTLTLNAKATLRLIDKESEKAPDYRLAVGSVECGAGWKKTSRENREYISVKLDDPTFPAPIYATLSETDTAGEYALIWSR
tara:strand:- start:22465 stop:23010 length:546 start_codon:yes stop_codon:yes gene_type:complete